MQTEEWDSFVEKFDQLALEEQLLLLERLIRRMRREAFMDEAEFAKDMERMAADPDIQRELRSTGL